MVFKKGQSGNPGGCPKGFQKPSAILKKFGVLSIHDLLALEHLTVAEEMCRRQILDACQLEDPGVRLKYVTAVGDRTEGRPHQSVEVRTAEITSPIQRDGTKVERAMAAAQLLRTAGLDVPVGLQAMIEAEDDGDE